MDSPQDVQSGPKAYRWKPALFYSAIFGGLTIFSDYYAVSPNGSSRILDLQLLTVLPLLAAIFMTLKAGLTAFRKRTRYVGLRNFLICLTFVVVTVGSGRIGNRIRMHAFAGLAQRSEPLVAAIKAYEQAHGVPPASLDVLVPEYLTVIPHTGIGAYPNYQYRVLTRSYDGDRWKLSVFTPTGILNFDEFFYCPLQNYPSYLWERNPVERIRDWAYVHE